MPMQPFRRRRTSHSILLALPLALAAIPVPAAAPADDTPATATNSFYHLYIQLKVMDVPSAKDRARFHPLLSPSLETLLADADKAEAAYAKKTRNDLPPLYEGDLFSSLVEGATDYKVGACEGNEQHATCTVELRSVDDTSHETKWRDRLVLIRVGHGWKVDDLAYGGDWDFGPHGTLRDVLKDLVKESREAD